MARASAELGVTRIATIAGIVTAMMASNSAGRMTGNTSAEVGVSKGEYIWE